MLYLFTALYAEARPLIRTLDLMQVDQEGSIRQFRSREGKDPILLTVMGTGPVKAAFSAGFCLGNIDRSEENECILYGSAAVEDPEGIRKNHPLYLVAGLKNLDSGRLFYPDLFDRAFPLAFLMTGSRIYQASDALQPDPFFTLKGQGYSACLHDMEAAAFFEAASTCLGPDQIHILKFVSDDGKESENLTAKDLEQMSERHLPELLSFLRGILKTIHEKSDRNPSLLMEDAPITAEELHASVAMENELQQLLIYGGEIGFSFSEERRILLEEGLLPCRDKKAGSKALERIRRDLLSTALPAFHDKAQDHKKREIPGKNTPWLIYIEEGIWDRKETREILDRIPNPKTLLPIRHYKDLFNRRRQNTVGQHANRSLILAKKKGQLIYPGAKVCQDFGNRYFYYTSCIMNCLFDCDYCYLKGLYPSGLPVIFVNLADIFKELEELLQKHPVYLSVSYDTDLVAVEKLTSYVRKWTEFTITHPDLMIEIRTKSGRSDLISKLPPCDRVIFAVTISPEEIRESYEHQTGSMENRLALAREAMKAGFGTRLCFDPMIYVSNWKEIYKRMFEKIQEEIDLTKIRDFSVGSFRISDSYLKQMRHVLPESPAVQFPFVKREGYYQYPERIVKEMEDFMMQKLLEYVPRNRIFLWEEKES